MGAGQESAIRRHTSEQICMKSSDFQPDTTPRPLPPVSIEPLDDWLHVRPSVEDEGTGKLIVPTTVQLNRLERVIVLASGSDVTDLSAGDLVLLLPGHAIELRDGTKIVQREFVVARVTD
jgi:hypothetical protein